MGWQTLCSQRGKNGVRYTKFTMLINQKLWILMQLIIITKYVQYRQYNILLIDIKPI